MCILSDVCLIIKIEFHRWLEFQKKSLHADKGGDSAWRAREPHFYFRGHIYYNHETTTTQW
jgi:hypothetical protein